jgi:hypothetical protein
LWDGITVRVGVPYGHDMAEEDFEKAGRHKDELEKMKNEIQDRSTT